MKFDTYQISKFAQATAAMFKRLIGKIPQSELVELLVKEEAQIGGKLFSDYDPLHPRQFVRIDAQRWLWREPKVTGGYETVIYNTSPQGVTKQYNGSVQTVVGQELENLHAAITSYSQKVQKLYATL